MAEETAPPLPPRSPLLWGVFCACSWTWCIGMYLPVLLIERLGFAGFVAFAIPNVLGCAGMAFVLHAISRRHNSTIARNSAATIERHGLMIIAFSVITAAFQVFFAVWLVDELIPRMTLPAWSPLAVGLVVYGLGLLFAFLPDRDWLGLAVVTYAISIIALAWVGTSGFAHVPWRGYLPPAHVWWLAPMLCFGFLLCPYLDATFHRAAQSASQPRMAFVIFGIAFAIMLGLTVLLWFHPHTWSSGWLAVLALGHVIAQLIFTLGVHLREVRISRAFACWKRRSLTMALPAAAIIVLPLSRLVISDDKAGQWAYLSFLACYGLLFPAYVVIAMATGRPLRSRGERTLFVMLVLACVPAMAMGFLLDRTPWLIAPIAVFVVWGHLRKASTRLQPPA